DDGSAGTVRLHPVFERYLVWLQSLTLEDRQPVQTAASTEVRLRIIKELREREWVNRLPLAVREELGKLTPAGRHDRLAELRRQEQQWRDAWREALKNWNDVLNRQQQAARLKELIPQVKVYVREFLYPALGTGERKRLLETEGQGLVFARTLVELADKHA